jgi:WD40 repeat protein
MSRCCTWGLLASLLLASPVFAVSPPPVRRDHLGDPLPPGAVARLGTLRLWHGEPITAVAISPDGRMIASSSDLALDDPADGVENSFSRIFLWEARSGKQLREIRFPIERVGSLAFSADGRLLAAAASSVALYDTATGKEVRRLPGPEDDDDSTALFLPDGKTVAVIEHDDLIRFHDVHTGKCVRRLEANKPKPVVLKNGDEVEEGHKPVLSLDGKVVAWNISRWTRKRGGQDSNAEYRIEFRSAKTGKLCGSIPDPVSFSFALDRTGTMLATIRSDERQDSRGAVEVWDTRKGAKSRTFEVEDLKLYRVALSPDRNLVAAASAKGVLLLWNTRTGKLLHRLRLPDPFEKGNDACLAFSADSRLLVVGFAHRVFLIDSATGKQSPVLTLPNQTTSWVRFSPDGKGLLSGKLDNAHRWDTSTWKGRQVPRPTRLEDQTRLVAIDPDGNLLVNPESPDGEVQLRDAGTGKTLRVFAGLRHASEAQFAESGRAVLIWSEDRGIASLSIRDGRTGKLLRKVKFDPGPTNPPPLLSPCGRFLGWGSRDGTISLLEVGSGRKSRLSGSTTEAVPGSLVAWLIFSSDSERVAVFSQPYRGNRPRDFTDKVTVRVWQVGTGKPVGSWVMPELTGNATFTADGRTLLTGHLDARDVYLWDVATGRLRGRLRGHRGEILSLALSPDGRPLASGSADNTILVWDLHKAIGPSGFFKDRLSDKELQRLWSELGDKDPVRAGAAVAALAAAPRDGVPFLRRRLKPACAPSAKAFSELIRQMDSPDFATRESAYRRLADCGDAVESGLLRARRNKLDFELHQRIGRLLEVCRNPGLSAERLRELRAVEVLERIGDRDSREVLRSLAKGVSDARLTLEAKAALRRLDRRAGSKSD